MKNILLAGLFLFMGVFAQAQIAHDVTIYSVDGLKFTFTGNGQVFNEEPSSRVEIKNIEHEYLRDVVIRFEDESIPPIKKKAFQIGEISGDGRTAVSLVTRIVEKKGKYKLKFVSRSPKKIQQETIIIKSEEKEESDGIQIKKGGVRVKIGG